MIEESIVDPNAMIAKGFPANVMPANYGSADPAELEQLVEYLIERHRRPAAQNRRRRGRLSAGLSPAAGIIWATMRDRLKTSISRGATRRWPWSPSWRSR